MRILINDNSVNLGGVYENAVAQELNSHGYSMFFFNSHKTGELDFLIEQEMSVVPLEVKSGKDYYIHSALTKSMNNPEYDIQKAYVLSNYNISSEGNVIYLPIYLAAFIQDTQQLPVLSPIQ